MKKTLFMIHFLSVPTLMSWNESEAVTSSSTSKILLVVNKQPITERDLQQRIKLLTFGAGNNAPVLSDAQRSEILSSLVNESLQIQEAQKAKVIVKDQDIMATIGDIAKDNGMTTQQFLDMLKSNGIYKETLYNRIKAQISWVRYIRQRYSPLVYVSDGEAEGQLKKMNMPNGGREFQIQEIFFPMTGSSESETKKNASDWVEKIRQGMKFETVAENLGGGSLSKEDYWRPISALDSVVADRVSGMKIGQVSEPLKVTGGFKVIRLKDMRHTGKAVAEDMQITMVQALLPVPMQPTEDDMNKFGPIIEELQSSNGCKTFLSKINEQGFNYQEHKDVRLGQLPDPLQDMAKNTPLGKCFQPIMTPDGLIITMVCQRKEAKPVVVTKRDITDNLEQQKFGNRAERELQRIRTVAYIEAKDDSARKLLKIS